MRPHLVAGLAAAAVALSACGGQTPDFTSDLGEDAPARVNDLSEIARFGLLFTDGEPLIDPTELVDAASFDGIPSVNDPVLLSRQSAAEQLVDTEQVMLVEHQGVARAYPVRSLIRHEIVNDVFGVIAGLAVDGPLKGERLRALPHQDAFWFAWAALQPGTALVTS